MSLAKGDHLVIKRNGYILTPDVGEGHHEFEVTDPHAESRLVDTDGSPCPPAEDAWWQGKTMGVDYFQEITIRVLVDK